MSTPKKPRTRATKEPLKVQLVNASGKPIEGIILAGELPEEDPVLAMARIMSKYQNIEPTPVGQ